ncbi:twitching motility protein PilT [Opitutaceae bacterium TAV5]|nr:twitching motility protein PilT [Opitutaceae bacterium TAV5]
MSVVSRIEVLGYHRITSEELADLQLFLAEATELSLDDEVVTRAIAIRQQRNTGLADAIIAATALAYDWELVTRNVDDFRHVPGLKLINPFDDKPGIV